MTNNEDSNEYPIVEVSTLKKNSSELLQKFQQERQNLWQKEEGTMTLNDVDAFITAGLSFNEAQYRAVSRPEKYETARTQGPLAESDYWLTSDQMLTTLQKWQRAKAGLAGNGPITDTLQLLGELESEQRQMWEAAINDTSLAEQWLKPNALTAKEEVLDLTTKGFKRAQQVVINTWSLNNAISQNGEELLQERGYYPLSKTLTEQDERKLELEVEEIAQSFATRLRNVNANTQAELFTMFYHRLKNMPNGLRELGKALCIRARPTTEEESDDIVKPTFDDPKQAFLEIFTLKGSIKNG